MSVTAFAIFASIENFLRKIFVPADVLRKAFAVSCCVAAAFLPGTGAQAQGVLRCGHFTEDAVAAPAPREARWPVHRFEEINKEVRTQPHRVLFLGDSITERFPHDAPQIWHDDMVPRGVLDAGVSGDRTEHLLWRMQHGNLAGPAPKAAVMLIGTNDLTNGGAPRPPALIAEGIRADLLYLRRELPRTRVLLLGLWPRADVPHLATRIPAVNRLIRRCDDDDWVVYADIGGVLLDPDGRLDRAISPDLLHFSQRGYARLAPRLDALIDRVTGAY